MNEQINPENALVMFEGKQIRRIWHDNEWYFSVVDVVKVLTDSRFFIHKCQKQNV